MWNLENEKKKEFSLQTLSLPTQREEWEENDFLYGNETIMSRKKINH